MNFKQTIITLCSLMATGYASAHHSRNNFDLETVLEFQGVITEYSWRNPHTFATVAVETETGESRELLFELNSVSVISREGWTRDTMKAGDAVTVFANPDQDPDKNLYYSNYWVLPNGHIMVSSPGSAPDTAQRRQRRQLGRVDAGDVLRSLYGRNRLDLRRNRQHKNVEQPRDVRAG